MNNDFKEQVGECLGSLEISKDEPTKDLSPLERESVANQIKVMSEREMQIVLENIPMDLIFSHIGNVLEKNRKFIQSINDAVAKFT